MKAFLYGLLLAGMLLVPLAAEARGGGGGGVGGGRRGGGGHSMGGQSLATFPFQSTIGVARQAAIISRLRAQQSTSNLITASGGLLGLGEFGGGFGGVGGGFSGIPGGAIATAGTQARAPTVAHPRVITVTPSQTTPGQIQIMRGTTIENVNIASTN